MKLLITTLAALSLVAFLPSCGSLQALNVNPSVNVSPKVQIEVSPFSGLGYGRQLVVDGTVKKVYLRDGLHWVDVQSGKTVVPTSHKKACTCKVGDKVKVQGTSYEVVYEGKSHLYVKDSHVL